MKLLSLIIASACLSSCMTVTSPDGIKTTRFDAEAFKLGAEVVKAYAPARGTVTEVRDEK